MENTLGRHALFFEESFVERMIQRANFDLQMIADELAESRTLDGVDALIFEEFANQD